MYIAAAHHKGKVLILHLLTMIDHTRECESEAASDAAVVRYPEPRHIPVLWEDREGVFYPRHDAGVKAVQCPSMEQPRPQSIRCGV